MPSTLETVLIGLVVLLVLLWFRPGIRAAMEKSRRAEKHWGDVIVPLAAVVIFVLFLIAVT